MDVYPLLPSFRQGILITTSGWLLYYCLRAIYNVFFHPLSRFPGPRGAACTRWWLAYMELGRGVSLSTLRAELHQRYGDVIRIAPNELHFARPTAYNDIYSPQNKWDKDHEYYRAFDTDKSFFAQTDYLKSKHGRTLISNLFSKRAVSAIQSLIRGRVRSIYDCPVTRAGKASNLYLGFQCFSADTIAAFLYSTSFDQLSSPGFRGDIIEGAEIAIPSVTVAKFSAVFVWIIRNFPHSILMVIYPRLTGVVLFRRTLEAQIKGMLKNPRLLDDVPHRIIYSEFLKPEANKGRPTPTALQLLHEALVLFAAGSHTVGTALMTGTYYLLRNPDAKQRLVDEVRTAWPVLDQPPNYEELEKLPFLASTAVIKETLRMAAAVPAGLPRVVPPSGAVISGVSIPGGTVVSQSTLFVSFSEEVFARPREFLPDRWIQPSSKALENWLVSFSKGPRSCLGINLAYCELYLTFAHVFRRFDVREDLTRPADLTWSEHFLPLFEGQHLHAYCEPRSD
ncbi:putative cytochrome P450 [Russula brevipes]|nr:putative cytochrome P450 [Russula brevipes]